MWKRLLYLYVILFFSSCSAIRKTSIEVLTPSEFSFPEITDAAAILNNSAYFSVDTATAGIMASLKTNEIEIIDTIVIRNLFDGFFSILDESPSENLRNVEYFEIRSIREKQLPEPLSEAAVVDFCLIHKKDAIISFEHFDLNLRYTLAGFTESPGFNYVEAKLYLHRQAVWRIYNSNGLILNEYFQNDTLTWSNSDYRRNDAFAGLPLASEAVRTAFFSAGEDYAKRISPYWLNVNRVYYSIVGMDRVDYSLNRDVLLLLSEHKNKKKSYKACYNLAFLSEKEDDLRSSLRWLEIAEFKNPSSPYASKYKKLIEERIANRQKIR